MADQNELAGAVASDPGAGPWYKNVTRANRRTLVAAFLGWGFDGYETFALVVVLVPMMQSLLNRGQLANLPLYGGIAVGTTLFGWAIGGVIGGILADYVGRKRVMVFSILAYAVFAGLTALAPTYLILLVLRFLTGLSLGSEWGTGTALIAETWPTRARAKAAGIMQAGFGVGSLLASLAWFVLNPFGPEAWRFIFLIGVIPALFALYVRARVPESATWRDAMHAKRWTATEADADGTVRIPQSKRRLTLVEIFSTPVSRRRVLLTLVLSVCSLSAYYTISTSLPLFVKELANAQGITHIGSLTSLAGIMYNSGAILGYIAGGFLADRMGRRAYIALFLIASVATTPLLYLTTTSLPWVIGLAAVNGFFTLGIFAAFAIYLPELFSSSVRATAISFVFNSTRVIAGVGPIVFGGLVIALGGVASAAVLIGCLYAVGLFVLPALPETNNRPIPA